ncbi:conserved hypothetical protein [Paecilomyces variotii No. 5]|uniref:Xylanolytic transcriptional activator regulatory domain-containing protein n=1 Tax=Byssochlamys spectabilis (strain No. 5 / NBRC 109023) TaxID=1356009 RepID=V5FEN3_BYSSN|nr:conserved hypothetical protein [Paecilomyces variotii No. 5]
MYSLYYPSDPSIRTTTYAPIVVDRHKLIIIIAAFMLNFSGCGLLFSFGIYQSLYKDMAQEKSTPFTGTSSAEISLIGSIAAALMKLGAPYVVAWCKYFSPQPVVCAGGLLYGVGSVLASFGKELWHFQLTQGLLIGVATCLSFMPSMTVPPSWFGKYRGLNTGIISAGTGIGGLVWSPILTVCIQSMGFRNTLRLTGCICTVLICASGAVLSWEPNMAAHLHEDNLKYSLVSGALKVPLPPLKIAMTRKFFAQSLNAIFQSAAYYTKEKPFQCTICSAGFARRYILTAIPSMPLTVKWVRLTAVNRDLFARHIRMKHEANETLSGEAEADLACHGESSSFSGCTPEGLQSASPSTSRIQAVQPPYDVATSHLSESTPSANQSSSHLVPAVSIQFGLQQRSSAMPPFAAPVTTLDLPPAQHTDSFGDFDSFIDSINGTYSDGISSFYVHQPLFPSPAAPLFPTLGSRTQTQRPGSSPSVSNQLHTSEPRLLDEFTSTLPSLEPFHATENRKEPWKVTQQNWETLFIEIQDFGSIIPQGFILPSRHTMTRYITTYLTGFHRHLPFIHSPTFSVAKCPLELLLAMATIGAISAFDTNNATMLFRTTLTISQERIRQRKEQRHNMMFLAEVAPSEQSHRFDPLPLAQALLILMAMATWGNSEAIFDEAVGIQNILVNFVRTERLLESQVSEGSTWVSWVQEERSRRTVAIIFCFLIFHTIIYDIPPSILSSELNIRLPSREKDWEAQTEGEWQQARRKHGTEPQFQEMLASLFSPQTRMTQDNCSSLGGYTMILALIQHIYFLRMAAKRRPEGEQGISSADMAEVEQALKNWQSGWNQDPESFLGPGSPLGPISFNSTALLRMAYIRLNVDLGSWCALKTHIPQDIAMSIYRSPPLATNPRLSRAVLYSAHALSIPVKIGINIVTHNQAFSWSLQHSLCALECAFIISKWLIAIQPNVAERTVDAEDARLYAYIVDMVNEAEDWGEMRPISSNLCSRVVRIWARIFSGTAHWNVVRLIGKILDIYAQILEI